MGFAGFVNSLASTVTPGLRSWTQKRSLRRLAEKSSASEPMRPVLIPYGCRARLCPTGLT